MTAEYLYSGMVFFGKSVTSVSDKHHGWQDKEIRAFPLFRKVINLYIVLVWEIAVYGTVCTFSIIAS